MSIDQLISVAKFGGSSLADQNSLERVKKIMLSTQGSINGGELDRRYMVLSAPGKRDDTDTKITEHLISIANAEDNQNSMDLTQVIVDRFKDIYPEFSLDQLEEDLGRRIRAELSAELYTAQLKAFGEEWNARLFTQWLNESGIDSVYADPKEWMTLHGDANNAAVKNVDRQKLMNFSCNNRRVIIPGFFAYDENNQILVFDRGGSDLTGAIVAEGVNASVYENFTDCCVMTADPQIVSSAKSIPNLTEREMRELAWGGSRILHHLTLLPLASTSIPVHVRGTKEFPRLGTYITKTRVGRGVVGVAYRDNLACFTMGALGTQDYRGILRDGANEFTKRNISIAFTSDSVDRISYLVDQDDFKKIGLVDEIKSGLNNLLVNPEWSFYGKPTGETTFSQDLGVIVVSGQGIRGNSSIGTKASQILDENNFAYRRFGGDMCAASLVYVLTNPKDEGHRAVTALHDALIN